MTTSTSTRLLYLDRLDIYKNEKPFEIVFETAGLGENLPATNVKLTPVDAKIHNARYSEEHPRLDKNGFQLIEFESELQWDDFGDTDKVTSIYYEEAKECVRRALCRPAELFILHHKVCMPTRL